MIMSLPSLKVALFLFLCVIIWSLLGVQKSLGHTQIGKVRLYKCWPCSTYILNRVICKANAHMVHMG